MRPSLVFDGATKDPMQMAVRDALISFIAALSQAQAEATKEAQRADIEHAKARDDAYRGRKPSFTRKQLGQVRDMLRIGMSMSTIAKDGGPLAAGDLPAQGQSSMGRGRTRDVGSLAFVCSTSPVRRSTPRALRH